MSNYKFVGRKSELEELERLYRKKRAILIVIKGRRRVGKTRLIKEFCRGKQAYTFTGLAPTAHITAQDQRDEFNRQLRERFSVPPLKADDWGDLLTQLALSTENKQSIIVLDEISWMGSKDQTFLSKLKTVWDTHFQNNANLTLILCGSVSARIEKNIVSSTGFLGRISHKITLEELPLVRCNELLNSIGFKGSDLEKFMLLSVTGGVPWYIELIDPELTAVENIRKLCFSKDGILVDEFKHIFHDLFEKRSEIYQKIVNYLKSGGKEFHEIAQGINYSASGKLSEYIDELVLSGFISRDFIWHIKTAGESQICRYRIKDNYLRFYLKYIKPNMSKIANDQYQKASLTTLPAWNSIIGLQFENLVLNNRRLVLKSIGIPLEDIVNHNPYFQRKTSKTPGCQIDYLIQTRFNTLIACEIKFSKNELSINILDEMKERLSNFKIPRGFSCFPVLIHINGVSEGVEDSDYFYKIIDFSDFLEG